MSLSLTRLVPSSFQVLSVCVAFLALKSSRPKTCSFLFLSGCKSAVFLQPFNTQHFIIFIVVVVYFIDRLGFLVPVFFICFFFFLFFYYFCLVSVLIPCMSCCVFPVATAHFNGATDPFVCEYLKDFYLRTRFLYLSPLFIYSYAKLIVKSFKSLHQN